MFRRVAHQNCALTGQFLDHRRVLHGLDRGLVEYGNNLRWRLGWRDHAVPVLGLQVGHADLDSSWDLRCARNAFRRADRDRLEFAGLDLWQQDGQVEEHHLDLLGQQVVHGGRGATVRHVHDIDAGCQLEQFTRQMR